MADFIACIKPISLCSVDALTEKMQIVCPQCQHSNLQRETGPTGTKTTLNCGKCSLPGPKGKFAPPPTTHDTTGNRKTETPLDSGIVLMKRGASSTIHMRTSDGAFTNQALAEAKQAQTMVNFLNNLGNTFIQENGTIKKLGGVHERLAKALADAYFAIASLCLPVIAVEFSFSHD